MRPAIGINESARPDHGHNEGGVLKHPTQAAIRLAPQYCHEATGSLSGVADVTDPASASPEACRSWRPE
jgi:hypothetical protein